MPHALNAPYKAGMRSDASQTQRTPSKKCEKCEKPRDFCICSRVQPIDTKTEILILRHPQEHREALGTAALTRTLLKNCTLRTGLSWRNLSHALGHDTAPSAWIALYLPGKQAFPLEKGEKQDQFFLLKKGKEPLKAGPVELRSYEGVLVLDGTWQQAKTLWWRNPWLSRMTRLAIIPAEPSLYGKLRREPRRECLSTLESIGCLLGAAESPDIKSTLLKWMRDEVLTLPEKR